MTIIQDTKPGQQAEKEVAKERECSGRVLTLVLSSGFQADTVTNQT
jgi:hypothetical protein